MNFSKNSLIVAVLFLVVFIGGVSIGVLTFSVWQNNKSKSSFSELKRLTPKSKEYHSKKQKNDSSLNVFPDTSSSSKNNKTKQNNRILSSNERKILYDKLKQNTLPTFDRNIIFLKGDIQWKKPREINNLGLTTDKMYEGCISYYNSRDISPKNICSKEMGYGSSTGVKYIKVGLILSGEFKDYEVILVKTGYVEGPSKDSWVTMLKKDNHAIFLLDNKQVSANKKLALILGNYFNKGGYKIEAMTGIKFEELETPEIIKDNKTGARFIKNKYDQAFFDKTNLQIAFQHPIYGTVWMSKLINPVKSKSELNSYKLYDYKNKRFVKSYVDIFNKNGFYIKLPNSRAVSYKLILNDISDTQEMISVIKASWNDGTVNDINYELNPSGCGSISYVYNVTGKLNIDTDLTVIGKTMSGKALYGFKNTSIEEFKKLYNDTYYAKDGKKSEDEFLLMRPQVFYVDSYNRLITFYRADILSPAECGKPVIYLYPEKPMDVNVQVKPNQGISVSEPKYPSSGWNVFAKPSGELTFAGKKYPYLFWEGSSDVSYQQSERGWVVKKDELNHFFDDKLKKLGLIRKEVDDFKEFWLPEMTKHNKPYYFITFLSQRKINQLAPLTITPKPDTIIRVMMDYRELDNYEETVGFNIKTPRREGFTAVEWGGMLK